MGKKYIVGIDGGSQSTKIVVFDLEGNIIAEGRENLRPMHLDDGGVVEHPGDDLWDSLCIAAKKAMGQFGIRKNDIIGIGLGSIRCCRVLLKKDGSLAQPVISWMDKRTATPYTRDNPEVQYVTSTNGYLTHRLTGEFKDNIGNHFGQWPVDYETWDWSTDEKVLEQFNLSRDMLFDVVKPGDILGHITEEASQKTGFPVGLPLVATTSDKAVEGLGAGLIHDYSAFVSLGTYISSMVTGKDMPKDSTNYWGIMSSIPEKYAYEGYGIRRGMWTVSWFKDLLGEKISIRGNYQDISEEEYLNEQAQNVPAGSDGLMTVLDWLANPWEPYKRGMMIGFNAHHDYRYMYRSILEGITYTMKNNVTNMTNELGKEIKEVIVTGGGSNSDLLMQIFADVFNLPVKRNVVNGSASVGAAINTAVGLGVYKSYEEAVDKMVKVKDVFTPKADNVAIYRRLNEEVYQQIATHIDPVLMKSYEILHPEN
ncbi:MULTISPECIES: FGGY-family carbohydrate kinase [Enterococcus]|uniref:Sugar kinase n=1 Tax=Enterococcus alishanensis TaxID=1303817 RepID=A0ABS6TEJ4_9ENTE|nr:FGGY family carbohydrate kinase [Enterococcus alishanensis]MBV7391282.1 sugar kinase [Enterococcus alishanensis]